MNPRVKIQLVPPTERCRESFLRGLREFQDEGLPWWHGGDLETAKQDFAAFVATKLADASRRTESFVPKTHLWAVTEEQFVGRISIHHELNDALRMEGGHIGYDTVPSYRGRGVATEMLHQALPVARALGLTAVLLTCNDTNGASIRVIERNGVILFHGIAMKPGKPTILGQSEGKPVFGLPGHPVAAYFVMQLFVLPLLDTLAGRTGIAYPMEARLTEAISSNHGRAEYMGVVLEEAVGGPLARPIKGKSGLITSLAGSDGYICVPRDCEGLPEGAAVSVTLWNR
jgi:predicted acetyltransferase